MATTINDVLAVNLQNFNSATAAANRTFTTTRQLRVFDFIARAYTTNGNAHNPQVLNGVTPIITIATPAGGSIANTIYRSGGNSGADITTCNDAQMTVATGGTIVFLVQAAGSNFDMNAMCFPV